MDCQELPCTRAQRATHFKRCLRSKTGCRALPLHANVLAASEMDCQELPCTHGRSARHIWSAELSQSPEKIAGQITLACWQNCECVARYSISCARGVYLLACVAVACVQDMLRCSVRDALPGAALQLIQEKRVASWFQSGSSYRSCVFSTIRPNDNAFVRP
ncbi:unnamed protein product [Effrenium voratum]|uniref:Uncharacterized protein n=1 Tax=Effrenium voratum TaxID=2562239 RepID=A0AA36JK93_9DINO|nr:unnamed protein product [Effrenium voratum]